MRYIGVGQISVWLFIDKVELSRNINYVEGIIKAGIYNGIYAGNRYLGREDMRLSRDDLERVSTCSMNGSQLGCQKKSVYVYDRKWWCYIEVKTTNCCSKYWVGEVDVKKEQFLFT